jgi:hypothetical protein
MVPLLISQEGENVGVERAVTRWYALRQSLWEEITRLEAKIAEPLDVDSGAQASSAHEAIDLQAVQGELAKAQEKLHLLGPCPQPMMG